MKKVDQTICRRVISDAMSDSPNVLQIMAEPKDVVAMIDISMMIAKMRGFLIGYIAQASLKYDLLDPLITSIRREAKNSRVNYVPHGSYGEKHPNCLLLVDLCHPELSSNIIDCQRRCRLILFHELELPIPPYEIYFCYKKDSNCPLIVHGDNLLELVPTSLI